MESIGLTAIFEDKNFQQGVARYQQGINQATSATDKGANAISAIGGAMKGALVVGIGASVAAFGLFAAAAKIGLDQTVQWGESLDKLGDMFGMTGPEASKWATAFAHFGVPVEEAAMQLNFLTRGLAETTKIAKDGTVALTPFGESLKKLGIKATDDKGKVKDLNTIMPELIGAFSKLPPGIVKSNLAMELFGARGGSKMLDFLSAGTAEVERLAKQTHKFGLALSTDEVDAIEKFGFALNDIKLGIKGFWTQIGIKLLPIAKQLVDFINNRILPALVQWAKDIMPILIARFKDFWSFVDKNILPVIQRLADAFKKGGLAGVFSQLATEIQKAIPAIFAALEPLKTQFWNWLTGPGGALEQAGEKLKQIGNAIQTWLKDNGPAIAAKFETLKTNFWNWLTGPGGVIEQIGTKLSEFIIGLDDWAKSGEGQDALYKTGKSFSKPITEGIVGLLADASTGESMSTGLQNTVDATMDLFIQVGKAIGSGLVDGIMEGAEKRWNEIDWWKLFGPGVTRGFGASFTMGLTPVISKAVDKSSSDAAPDIRAAGRGGGYVVTSGTAEGIVSTTPVITNAVIQSTREGVVRGSTSVSGDAYRAGTGIGASFDAGISSEIYARAQQVTDAIRYIMSLGLSGIPSFQSGGIMSHTGLAYLHAGERVIPAPSINNSRSTVYNFSHTWNAPVTASNRGMTENMVRQVTHQEIVSVFGRA